MRFSFNVTKFQATVECPIDTQYMHGSKRSDWLAYFDASCHEVNRWKSFPAILNGLRRFDWGSNEKWFTNENV